MVIQKTTRTKKKIANERIIDSEKHRRNGRRDRKRKQRKIGRKEEERTEGKEEENEVEERKNK